MTNLDLPKRRLAVLELPLPKIPCLVGNLVDTNDHGGGLWELLVRASWSWARFDFELTCSWELRRRAVVLLLLARGALDRTCVEAEAHHDLECQLCVLTRKLFEPKAADTPSSRDTPSSNKPYS